MKNICIRTFVVSLFFVPIFASAEPITSEDFTLRDASGKVTAQLTTSGDGTPAFFIYDKNGVVRISIGLYGDGAPGVVLNDEKGLAAAIMRLVKNDGEPVVVLKENGQDRYVIRENGPDKSAAPSGPSLMTVFLTAIISIIGSSLMTLYILGKRLPPSTPLPPQTV